MARYAYRWIPYHVSYERRRRAARMDVMAIAPNNPALTVAISTYWYVVMNVQNSATTLVPSPPRSRSS